MAAETSPDLALITGAGPHPPRELTRMPPSDFHVLGSAQPQPPPPGPRDPPDAPDLVSPPVSVQGLEKSGNPPKFVFLDER